MTNIQFIQSQVNTSPKNIEATLKLLSEDCTIPFISRYRKDQTGNLDEVVIEQIAKLSKQYDEIVKRKESILKTIEEQGQLSPELKSKIEKSFDLQEIEDLYLPYKKKKKTRADVARENGLEPLAKLIIAQKNDDVDFLSTQYINKNIKNEEEALQGARDIVAEWINETIAVRQSLRRLYSRKAIIESKVIKKKSEEEAAQKFSQYFEWAEPLTKAPSHRLLAMLRAENEGFVKIKIETDLDETYAGSAGTTVPGFRAIWCPQPNHPMFKEWAMVTWQRVAQKRGGQQIRHDAKWDFVRFSKEYVKTGIMVDPVAEGMRKKDGRRIQLEDLLATGTDGNLPFDICAATIYVPFPWPELRDRELFGWFLRMSESQIMGSDIAVKYLLDKSYK